MRTNGYFSEFCSSPQIFLFFNLSPKSLFDTVSYQIFTFCLPFALFKLFFFSLEKKKPLMFKIQNLFIFLNTDPTIQLCKVCGECLKKREEMNKEKKEVQKPSEIIKLTE